jgi:hypothetical protein
VESSDGFQQLNELLENASPEEVFAHLIRDARERGNYAQLFEARLMETRHRLGLPLLTGGPPVGLEGERRAVYDRSVMDAAKEAGELFLAAGDIPRAWPYFRALGEPEPVANAISSLRDAGDDVDAIIDVALSERVHPLRGLELVLAHHGICRAITCFDQYPDPGSRDEGLRLLASTLYKELRANMRRAIEQQEGQAPPEAATISELIGGREWLFGEYDYYVDTSHLISVLRFAAESHDSQTVALAIELAEYGKHLSPMFHHRGEPPLDDVYEDHLIWLRAMSGQEVEAGVRHFRDKVSALDLEQTGSYPAQVLVRFLLRLERYDEAVEVFERYLANTDPAYLMCPTLVELCRMAGDWERIRSLARDRGDLLTFAAASLAAKG